jgi:DNA-directed RNA polymerase specialized sigma24 family protein
VVTPLPIRTGIRFPRMPRAARDLAILRLREAGLSPQEIALALDVLPVTVGVALTRARKARKAVGGHQEEP